MKQVKHSFYHGEIILNRELANHHENYTHTHFCCCFCRSHTYYLLLTTSYWLLHDPLPTMSKVLIPPTTNLFVSGHHPPGQGSWVGWVCWPDWCVVFYSPWYSLMMFDAWWVCLVTLVMSWLSPKCLPVLHLASEGVRIFLEWRPKLCQGHCWSSLDVHGWLFLNLTAFSPLSHQSSSNWNFHTNQFQHFLTLITIIFHWPAEPWRNNENISQMMDEQLIFVYSNLIDCVCVSMLWTSRYPSRDPTPAEVRVEILPPCPAATFLGRGPGGTKIITRFRCFFLTVFGYFFDRFLICCWWFCRYFDALVSKHKFYNFLICNWSCCFSAETIF